MSSTVSSFERLISPVEPHEFYRQYWEKAHLHISRDEPSFYRSIMSFEDIDECFFLAQNNPGNTVSIVPGVDSDRAQTRMRSQGFSLPKLYAAFDAGDTLRISGLQKLWPPLVPLVASLTQALGATVNVLLYLTPAGSQAFPLHFDKADFFVVQLAGSKVWHLHEPTYKLPIQTLARQEGFNNEVVESDARSIQKVRLEAGDLLYLPRGFLHKVIATEEPSLHLTVSIVSPYWTDFLKTAVELVGIDDSEFRKALPPRGSEDLDLERISRTFHCLLKTLAEKVSPERIHQVLVADYVKQTLYPLDGHFAGLLKAEQLDETSLVERRQGLDCEVEIGKDSVALSFASNRVGGPPSIAPALKFMRDRKRFRVSELPGALSDASKTVLVRRLIREGLLRLADREEDR